MAVLNPSSKPMTFDDFTKMLLRASLPQPGKIEVVEVILRCEHCKSKVEGKRDVCYHCGAPL